jgi:hypothetical protein
MDEASIRKEIRGALYENKEVAELFGFFGKRKERPVFMSVYDRLKDRYDVSKIEDRATNEDYVEFRVYAINTFNQAYPRPFESSRKYTVRVFDNGDIIIEDKDKGKNLKTLNHDKAVAYMLSEYDRKKSEMLASREMKKKEKELAKRSHQEEIPQ